MNTSEQRRASLAGPIGLGVGLIIVGVSYLLDRLGILPMDWGLLWPIAPIIVGIVALITSIRNWWGLILIGVGVVFLLDNLVLGGIGDIWQLWPVAIIVVGIVFIVNAIRNRNKPVEGAPAAYSEPGPATAPGAQFGPTPGAQYGSTPGAPYGSAPGAQFGSAPGIGPDAAQDRRPSGEI